MRRLRKAAVPGLVDISYVFSPAHLLTRPDTSIHLPPDTDFHSHTFKRLHHFIRAAVHNTSRSVVIVPGESRWSEYRPDPTTGLYRTATGVVPIPEGGARACTTTATGWGRKKKQPTTGGGVRWIYTIFFKLKVFSLATAACCCAPLLDDCRKREHDISI